MLHPLALSAAAALVLATATAPNNSAATPRTVSDTGEQATVRVVRITIDRFATLSRDRGVATVTGELYCNGDGMLPIFEIDVRQGQETGYTNEGIVNFPCRNQGSRFHAAVENEDLWRLGRARVVRFRYAEDLPTGQPLVLVKG